MYHIRFPPQLNVTNEAPQMSLFKFAGGGGGIPLAGDKSWVMAAT